MDIPITEGIYSKDNYHPAFCILPDGRSCWTVWAAYGADGSRVFARKVDGETTGAIVPISPHGRMQTQPICVPSGRDIRFVWLEKEAQTYSVWTRRSDGDAFGYCEELAVLPASAKPWELQAVCDASGTLWVCWAQAERGQSRIQVVRQTPDGSLKDLSAGIGKCSYRPRMALRGEAGVYLVWDSYTDRGYDVYGCPVGPEFPGKVERISRDEDWENRATICRDREGALWVVWVRGQDVIYQKSVIQQKYSLRGARYDGESWVTLSGADGDADLAPLHYGLLTDFPHPPQLGHMGRRLFPILKSAENGGIWLFYETKADQEANTLVSRGRLCAQRWVDGAWSPSHTAAEGRMLYELPHNGILGTRSLLLAQDVETDELHLESVELSTDLPVVPEQHRRVDLNQWEEIQLPFGERQERPRNELPGEECTRYQLFWGDFHCHSSASIEMEGEPDELGHYARDKARIDALTISDNDNFWNRFTRQNVRHLKDAEWDYVKGNAMALDEPGRFAMFPGYEMTITDRVDSGRDHRSVMADDDEMEMDRLHWKYWNAYCRGERDTHKDADECVAWCKQKGYLVLPHPHHGKWNLRDTEVEWGVDVCAAWMISFDLYDIFFKYLYSGHKFAFTGSSDSHYRNPGLSGAVTGIWAEKLDRASLLEAIENRRCFATAGQKILMEFSVDGCMMGSSLTVREDPVLRWRVEGEAGQDYILRIHRDGRLMHDDRFVGSTAGELEEFMLSQYRPGKHYYYLEVLSPEPIPQYPANVAHALGTWGWTTPVWVETEE